MVARRAPIPSSMGMSFLVPPETNSLEVVARWGDYKAEAINGGKELVWKRTPFERCLKVELPSLHQKINDIEIPGSGGLWLTIMARDIASGQVPPGIFPEGTRALSIFLVNRRPPAPDEKKDEAFIFQAELEVNSENPFVSRPDIRGLSSDDWDDRVADLQYRDVLEHVVGHGVSAEAICGSDGKCRKVKTVWIPQVEVERVEPSEIENVELEMEKLAQLKDGDEAWSRLGPLVDAYQQWIGEQKKILESLSDRRRQIAEDLIGRIIRVSKRIEEGIKSLADPAVLEAFCIANRAMAAQARRRSAILRGEDANLKAMEMPSPKWRPFQLAFILMNIPAIINPMHGDRQVVDLLFFPTGGGKTEAYLGLAAFTLVYRRLRERGDISSAGVAVLMRYTLRLLTLDQLSRAAALICALELEREKSPQKLGEWPFEIGLWVGQAATPNKMGKKGDGNPESARAKTIAFQNDDTKPSPIPLENCPWCGTKFKTTSFILVPNSDQPTDLRVQCADRNCDFIRGRFLPIVAVDEPIYRRLPGFLIATVDKFAAMPWTGLVGTLFGRVDRYDKNGFYGPCDPGKGKKLERPLSPPELVIQDELHLISGPLGTMAALYETALDFLASKEIEGKMSRPKIVASTATVRRADDQIRGLFARNDIEIFPPPGPDRKDCFFAHTVSSDKSPAQLYLGVSASGRSPKVMMLRTYLALLGSSQLAYDEAGGKENRQNPADPYMTLVGYFNSLRELGGSRRIIEDEVKTSLAGYDNRLRVGEKKGLFGKRTSFSEVLELTSRVSTDKVAEARRRLGLEFWQEGRVDVAIATNMISVGLDIPRLGLMVVAGQPKTSSEYIQATSRVGRDPRKPGLIVTLLNPNKPRDRSHYECFIHYHRMFYRNVEATSVTPFSPRALDRGLAGTVVAMARQYLEAFTPPVGATQILSKRG
ncbi:MAG: DISARM system helicase DrmA, partial [Candidatus Bathyarchaeia archaeon]